MNNNIKEVRLDFGNIIHHIQLPPFTAKIEEEQVEERFHVRDLFLKSDLHGLPEWYEAHGCVLKAVWTIILILSLTCLTFEIKEALNDFRENPVITTYNLVSEPEELPFPEIYLCPSSPVHQEQRRKMNVDPVWEKENVIGLLKSHRNRSGLTGILAQKTTISQALTRILPKVQGGFSSAENEIKSKKTMSREQIATTTRSPPWIPNDVQDYFINVGYPLERFITECSFNSIQIPCHEIATAVFDGDYGKCFIVRPPINDPRQRTDGVGLNLVLSLDWESQIQPPTFSESELSDDRKPDPVLYDSVIMKTEHKLDIGSAEFTLLEPGHYIHASLEATKMTIAKRRKRKHDITCMEQVTGINNYTHLRFPIYSKGICYQDCVQKVVNKSCSCFMPIDRTFLKNKQAPLCNVKNLTTCAFPAIFEQNKTIAACTQWCKTPCTHWKYQVVTSFAKFPSEEMKYSRLEDPYEWVTVEQETGPPLKKQMQQDENYTDEHEFAFPPIHHSERRLKPNGQELLEAQEIYRKWTRGDMLILDLAYSSLQFVEITQEDSMTFTTFVSNIGGQVGLWIGASMITMVKFFVLLAPLCCGAKKCGGKRKQKPVETPTQLKGWKRRIIERAKKTLKRK